MNAILGFMWHFALFPIFQTLLESSQEEATDAKYTFVDIFKTPNIRWLSIWLGILWWGTISFKVCTMRTAFQAKKLSSLSTFLVYNQAKISLGQFQHWHFIDLTINLLLIKNPGVSIVYVVNIYVECRQKEGHKWWKKKQKHNKTQKVNVCRGCWKKR